MKNRKFFLDVDPKSNGLSEEVGNVKYEIHKDTDDDWGLDISTRGFAETEWEYLEGIILSVEELRALYNILTLECDEKS